MCTKLQLHFYSNMCVGSTPLSGHTCNRLNLTTNHDGTECRSRCPTPHITRVIFLCNSDCRVLARPGLDTILKLLRPRILALVALPEAYRRHPFFFTNAPIPRHNRKWLPPQFLDAPNSIVGAPSCVSKLTSHPARRFFYSLFLSRFHTEFSRQARPGLGSLGEVLVNALAMSSRANEFPFGPFVQFYYRLQKNA